MIRSERPTAGGAFLRLRPDNRVRGVNLTAESGRVPSPALRVIRCSLTETRQGRI
jgi:hypothetical protein